VNGLHKSADTLSEKIKAFFIKNTRDLDFSRITLIEYGTKPMQKGEAGALLGVGIFLLVVCIAWVVMRRKRARRASMVEAAEADIRDGIAKAISEDLDNQKPPA